MMNFMDEMAIINNKEPNISITENDALGYRTSGSALVDLNFSISSLRNESDDIVIQSFLKAFNEDKELALKWLFYVRDIRMGVGERRLFRVILRHLSIFHPNEIKHLIQYIPEYGRWDDLLELLETNLEHDAILMILNQIEKDHESMKNGKPISLIGKWLPSCNTSSKRTIKLGKRISRLLNMSERKYRMGRRKCQESSGHCCLHPYRPREDRPLRGARHDGPGGGPRSGAGGAGGGGGSGARRAGIARPGRPGGAAAELHASSTRVRRPEA